MEGQHWHLGPQHLLMAYLAIVVINGFVKIGLAKASGSNSPAAGVAKAASAWAL
jgi:hypothetical protein